MPVWKTPRLYGRNSCALVTRGAETKPCGGGHVILRKGELLGGRDSFKSASLNKSSTLKAVSYIKGYEEALRE